MSQTITPGTKGYIHRPKASRLSFSYIAVTVVGVEHHTIAVMADNDLAAEVHEFTEDSRSDQKGTSRTLILEGEPGYRHAAQWVEWNNLRIKTARTVRQWSYDEANPGKALAASEALRVLASTPEPRKD